MLIIDPEREAKRILDRFEVIHPPVNVESIARGLGLWVVYKEMELRTSGMLVRRGRQATIGVNQAHHIHRQRFTIAHELGHHLARPFVGFEHGKGGALELGHHLMHHSLVELHVDRALVAFRDDASTLGDDPVEVEANAFAAALLMPAHFLSRDLRAPLDAHDDHAVRQLARRYQVSPASLTFRLINLGKVRGG